LCRNSTIELKSSLGSGDLIAGGNSVVKSEITALSTKLAGLKSTGDAICEMTAISLLFTGLSIISKMAFTIFSYVAGFCF
jgi:hypothetical protein